MKVLLQLFITIMDKLRLQIRAMDEVCLCSLTPILFGPSFHAHSSLFQLFLSAEGPIFQILKFTDKVIAHLSVNGQKCKQPGFKIIPKLHWKESLKFSDYLKLQSRLFKRGLLCIITFLDLKFFQERDGGAHMKFRIKPLKETNLGVV